MVVRRGGRGIVSLGLVRRSHEHVAAVAISQRPFSAIPPPPPASSFASPLAYSSPPVSGPASVPVATIPAAPLSTPHLAGLGYNVLAPMDLEFCFHVDLDRIPVPPSEENFLANKHSAEHDRMLAALNAGGSAGEGGGAAVPFSIQDFVSAIPSYFVPVDELLEKHLKGYTHDHIDMYFGKARGLQIVNVAGVKYIRLFGGFSGIDMADSVYAEALFPQYKIEPSLAIPYIHCFQDIRRRWMPLRLLIEKGGKAAEDALPFKGPATILFFAQLQHIFAFAPDNGGAVQLLEDGYDQLNADTSPCPLVLPSLLTNIVDQKHDISEVFNNFLTDADKAELLRFFPSVEEGIRRHGKVFYIEPDTRLVMRTRLKEREELNKLPLEKQLEIAIQNRDKKRSRVLRRRIQTQKNPDNPLLDKDNVAREVFNYIPKRGFVPLTQLVRKSMPVELLDFLGNDHIRFFKNYPQYFQIFEFREATKWCVARHGVQLPQGVLRTSYTEEEIIRIIASIIQRRGAMSAVRITLYVPDGVREAVRKYYISMYHLCLKYPQYFSILKRSETKNAEASSIVSLLSMPLEGAAVDSVVGGDDSGSYVEEE